MIYILIGVILVLLAVNLLQYQAQRRRDKDLDYMHHKLNEIINSSSSEQLLLATGDKHLKQLLIEINRLFAYHQKKIVNYNKMEISIRKMLSNISHDLKTPLTVVLGYSETLLHDRDMDGEERERLLLKVQEKADEVLQLMNKFFDLAKLESGDQNFPLTRINMSEVCRHAILTFYDLLSSQGFDVRIVIPDEAVYAHANEEALHRILNNLLSNAIEYGGDGKVVGLTLRYDEKDVYVDVWDRGKGIHETQLDLIFERMYTLEDSRNKRYQGSGLGLTITKRLVEQLGGEISVQSKPYERTVFTFRLKRMTY